MLKQLSKLLSGSAIGQLLAFIIIPYLTHVYSPESLGEYQVVLSASMLFSILLTLKLEIAIPTLNTVEIDLHTRNTVKVLFINVVVMSSIILMIANFTELLPTSLNKAYLIISFVIIATLMAASNIFRFYLIEQERFGIISMTLFVHSGGRGILQGLLNSFSSFGLMLGDILSKMIMIIFSLKILP